MLSDQQNFEKNLLQLGAASSLNIYKSMEYLLNVIPSTLKRDISCSGWRDNNKVFVSDFGIYGNNPDLIAQYNFKHVSKSCRDSTQKGNWQLYIKQFQRFVECSDYLAFTFLCALLTPLAQITGETEGFTVNLAGLSSTGKTLALRLAQSVFAEAHESDLISFNQSESALARCLVPEISGMG